MFTPLAGYCRDGKCVCYPGFTGVDCTERLCPRDCSFRGACVNGECQCKGNYTGAACERARCPSDCTSPERHERCDDGVCVCKPGYSGVACEQRACPENCNERGACDAELGVCRCEEGWTGDGCEVKRCPDDCSGRGLCIGGSCYCEHGFVGRDCATLACPCEGGKRSLVWLPGNTTTAAAVAKNVSKIWALAAESATSAIVAAAAAANRVSVASCECKCYKRGLAHGPECRSPCPLGCSGHGECRSTSWPYTKAKCECDKGWGGTGCEVPLCPNGE